MAEATDSTETAGGKRVTFIDLEGQIVDLVRLSRIADAFVEDTLGMNKGESWGDYRKYTLHKEELKDVAFLMSEVQSRTRELSDAFFNAIGADA